jgi:hypothetical protein
MADLADRLANPELRVNENAWSSASSWDVGKLSPVANRVTKPVQHGTLGWWSGIYRPKLVKRRASTRFPEWRRIDASPSGRAINRRPRQMPKVNDLKNRLCELLAKAS